MPVVQTHQNKFTIFYKKKYLPKLSPVILRSQGLSPVHICHSKKIPPTKKSDFPPTQNPRIPCLTPGAANLRCGEHQKLVEKEINPKKNGYGNTCPTLLRQESIPNTRDLKNSGSQMHSVLPSEEALGQSNSNTPTILKKLSLWKESRNPSSKFEAVQAFSRGRRSVRSATQLHRKTSRWKSSARNKCLHRSPEKGQEAGKWQEVINGVHFQVM